MFLNQLRPEMRVLVNDAVERFSKRHLAQDVESDHLIPIGHIHAPGLVAQFPDFFDELIN